MSSIDVRTKARRIDMTTTATSADPDRPDRYAGTVRDRAREELPA